ncbi:hypothetical protein FRC0436_01688 [Corynebacterium diphtheriae]|nr:hypothetical protein FRC0087_01826 [Corynebacterium diphtheriae]CAB0911860.1 hypothetical protein FRC0430_01687 [Corynebacterium diphtheriae]CAB0962977.1 hypothetical protein FRC0436_01688 [Corynebacterium diphtheriae]
MEQQRDFDTTLAWHRKAKCAGKPGSADVLPGHDKDANAARVVELCAMCADCPVFEQCGREAIAEPFLALGVVRAGIPDTTQSKAKQKKLLQQVIDEGVPPPVALIMALKDRKGYEGALVGLAGLYEAYRGVYV